MHWTSEVPTKEGWWWLRLLPQTPPECVYVDRELRYGTFTVRDFAGFYTTPPQWSNEPLLEPVTVTFAPPAPPTEAEMEVLRGMKPELDQMREEMDQAERIAELEAAIREHHAQKADDRCIEDDDRLYAAVGLPPCDRRVGDKAAMLANCQRFIERRCEGGGWPSYAELEAKLAAAAKLVEEWRSDDHPTPHFATSARCADELVAVLKGGDQFDNSPETP